MELRDTNTEELLAYILGGENKRTAARALLARYSSLQGLAEAPVEEIARAARGYGVGKAAARRIKAAGEVGRRLLIAPKDQQTIRGPQDAAAILIPRMALLPQEEVHVMLLNQRHHVIDVVMVHRGSVNRCDIRPAEIFREAVRHNAPAIVVAHNHPSGDPEPSQDDCAVTRRLFEAGELLDIKLLDHLVIGGGTFVSLKERNVF